MKQFILVVLTSIVLLGSGNTAAQVAGSTTVGVTAAELKQVILGWSAKKKLLGKNVFNETNEKLGKVEDIIIAPDKSVSYVIIGTGGFVGLRKHNVAIPMGQIQEKNGKLVLPGATKEAVKALPPFEYTKDKK